VVVQAPADYVRDRLLDADFEITGAPELAAALRKLAARYERAAQSAG
jgi:hypothetical protein